MGDSNVETCKRQIRYRARWACIDFKEEDIVTLECEDGIAVFLSRQFLGYKKDRDGILILDGNFELIPIYKPLMWYEEPSKYDVSTNITEKAWETTISVRVPKLRCLTPWLIFIIKDGVVKSHDYVNNEFLPNCV